MNPKFELMQTDGAVGSVFRNVSIWAPVINWHLVALAVLV